MNDPLVPAAPAGSHRVVRRNALWNLLGLGLPLALAFLFIPRLVSELGAARFGILSLMLTFLNYFGFFDLGIGRALTQLLADGDPADKKGEAGLVWTVSGLLGIFGAGVAVIVFFLAPHLVYGFLKLGEPVAGETVIALRLLGISLPFLIHSLALRGILEARRRFDLSNMVRIPAGVFTFGAPILILPFTHNLAVMVALILSGRFLAWGLNLWIVFHLLPHLSNFREWNAGDARKIIRFGGWFTASNVAGPIIDSMDRFLIGRFLSVSMVSFYTVPYDMIVRLGILSGSVGGAIFPEFAARLRASPQEAARLYARGFKYLLALLFPFVLIATVYAREGLSLWLNPEFAAIAASPLQWLSILVLVSGINNVSVALLHGAGRPDITGRMHLLELPLLAGMLYVMIRLDGIRGAAIACTLRIVIEFLTFFFFSGRIMKFKPRMYARLLAPVFAAVAVLLGFQIPLAAGPKFILFLSVVAAYACVTWVYILEHGDKANVLRLFRRARRG